MNDYSQIKRVVIKRLASPEDIEKATELLSELNQDIEAVKHAAAMGMITPIVFRWKMQQVDSKLEKVAKLMGFASYDDMDYYRQNFIKL